VWALSRNGRKNKAVIPEKAEEPALSLPKGRIKGQRSVGNSISSGIMRSSCESDPHFALLLRVQRRHCAEAVHHGGELLQDVVNVRLDVVLS